LNLNQNEFNIEHQMNKTNTMIQSTRNTVNHPLLAQPQLATDGRLKTSTTPNINWFGRRVKTQLELIQTDSIECSSPFTQKLKSPLHLQNNTEKEVDLIQSSSPQK